MPYDKDLHDFLKAAKKSSRSPAEAVQQIKKTQAAKKLAGQPPETPENT